MTADWTPLRRELAQWRADGLSLPLWWRDDDAVSATPALSDLSALSDSLDIPVHIAVIPKFADDTLAAAVAESGGRLIPLVHGWAHENHAATGQKTSEFGANSVASERLAQDGLNRLAECLHPHLVSCFVPPWNRMDMGLAPKLAGIGYHSLSTYGPRQGKFAAPGLEQINTHIDPINWRGDRSVVPLDHLIATLVQTLQDRRTGRTDKTEPLGLLTHHLVHDTAIWNATKSILSELLDGPTTLFRMTPKDPI